MLLIPRAGAGEVKEKRVGLSQYRHLVLGHLNVLQHFYGCIVLAMF